MQETFNDFTSPEAASKWIEDVWSSVSTKEDEDWLKAKQAEDEALDARFEGEMEQRELEGLKTKEL